MRVLLYSSQDKNLINTAIDNLDKHQIQEIEKLEDGLKFIETYKEFGIFYNSNKNCYIAIEKGDSKPNSENDDISYIANVLYKSMWNISKKTKFILVLLLAFISFSSTFIYLVYFDYDDYGFNVKGINKTTKTKYDENGFDKQGINKDTNEFYDIEGYNKFGYDKQGMHKDEINLEKERVEKSSKNNLKTNEKGMAEDFAIIFVETMLMIPESKFTSVSTLEVAVDTYVTKISVGTEKIEVKVGYVDGVLQVLSVDI